MKTEVKSAFEFLAEHAGKLNDSQIHFLKSLQKYYKENKHLTERQRVILFDIKKYVSSCSDVTEMAAAKTAN